jgi:molybdate transport system substrate-binding protein
MIGCTQVTEIRYTPGVTLAGPLPVEFELATLYSAAMLRNARLPVLARSFIDELAGPGSSILRGDGGFDPIS